MNARADVYALGRVIYEMLTGQLPFTGVSTQAVIAKPLTDDPVPLTRHRRSVPLQVEGGVLRALEKLPADRLPSAGAFPPGEVRRIEDALRVTCPHLVGFVPAPRCRGGAISAVVP